MYLFVIHSFTLYSFYENTGMLVGLYYYHLWLLFLVNKDFAQFGLKPLMFRKLTTVHIWINSEGASDSLVLSGELWTVRIQPALQTESGHS